MTRPSGCLNLLNISAQNIRVPVLLQLYMLCPCIAFMICQLRVKLQVNLNLLNLFGAPLFDQPIVGPSQSIYTFDQMRESSMHYSTVKSCFQGHKVCIT